MESFRKYLVQIISAHHLILPCRDLILILSNLQVSVLDELPNRIDSILNLLLIIDLLLSAGLPNKGSEVSNLLNLTIDDYFDLIN